MTTHQEKKANDVLPPTDGGLTVEEIAALREGGLSDAIFLTQHPADEQVSPSEHEEVQ